MRGRAILAALAACAGLTGTVAQTAPTQLNFVACPVVRRTEPVLCWLSQYRGELYYLGVQGDISEPFHPPQLKHRVLIEGVVSHEPRICGGIVLKPVTVSVLPELDPACNRMLPGKGYRVDFAPRGPGPANRGMQLATDPNPTPRAAPPGPPGPFEPKVFTVAFGFDGDYINVHSFQVLQAAATYAKAARAKQVTLSTVRGASLLSNGKVLTESPGIADLRARKVTRALSELGVGNITATASNDPRPADGHTDAQRRNVEILVTP